MMEKVQTYLQFHLQREYRKKRKTVVYENIDPFDINARLEAFLREETPLIFCEQQDIFGFNRTVKNLPEGGSTMGNFTPDYAWALSQGYDEIEKYLLARANDPNEAHADFFRSALHALSLTYDFCDRYKAEAKKRGAKKLYEALSIVPRKPPQSYYQALVFMKIVIFILRAMGALHVTLGRFDQYLYPFFCLSKANGESGQDLLEQTELFFVSINMDTDLYHGLQQGDNGQSLLLGGRTLTQEDAYNELSETVMQASEDLCLIDPKINLRVNKNTPIERYIRATHLTKKGLGFPQYCNDDVVIEGLQRLGYDYEDAVDYTVAACWEFLTLNGHDVPNLKTMNFPLVVRNATMNALEKCEDFETFMQAVETELIAEIGRLKERPDRLLRRSPEFCNVCYPVRNPFGSLFIKQCRETGVSASEFGAKYNNFGMHGLGIAPAADALAAIKKCVFDDHSLTPARLLAALENNFAGEEALRNQLIACPKMGNNDPYVDDIAVRLIGYFSEKLNNTPNSVGGIWRAGTGGPHDYIYCSKDVGATADGRLAGQPYPSSFSPAIGAKTEGPLSVIKSFTRSDMKNTINGGPLTMEIHANVFRNDDGVKKVAMLVKAFIDRGGHQLQLNSVCRETLLDAQAHPEQYPDLIVRVWGWSGYFTELDLCFQNQIISRTEYLF